MIHLFVVKVLTWELRLLAAMMVNRFSYSVSLTVVICLTIAQGFRQELWLYNGFNEETSDHLYFQSNIPSLLKYYTSDVVLVCARGAWSLYGQENYVVRSYDVGQNNADSIRCTNITFADGVFKSTRHFGPSDTTIEALSLYDKGDMFGEEILWLEDEFDMPDRPAYSFALTGTSSWSLYEYGNFTGYSYCYEAPTDGRWISWGSGPPFGIRSGRKGCL